MKYAIKFEVDMTTEELARACAAGRRCPLENVNVTCPFGDYKICSNIEKQDWKNLEYGADEGMRISYLAPNQTVLHFKDREVFVSYETPIVEIKNGVISVRDGDSIDWPGRTVGKPPLNYSATTSKYLCRFLDKDKPAIYAGIKYGTIHVVKEIEI